jgi:protein-tyrosine phosphatase
MKQRVLSIEGTLNFRDLGGYINADGRSVKWGKLYRSAQLNRMSPKGIQDMAALGIQTVVDLRFTDESNKSPTIAEAVPNAEMLSWHSEREHDSGQKSDHMIRSWRDSLDSNDPAQVREAMRINYPQKLYTHRAIYKKMLLRIAEGNTPLVFHCAAGKDRTGVAAALILSLIGVDDQQIVDDYLLTQKEIEGRMETWLAGGATTKEGYQDFQSKLARQPREMIKPVLDADITYIETLLDYVKEKYGSFHGYAVDQLELADKEVDALQVQLLS